MYNDCEIQAFQAVCPEHPVGTHRDVGTALNLAPLRAAGAQGAGVKVVVVDGGIDGTRINVSGGYNPRPGVAPGTAPPGHGTMVAFDALIAAPRAMIYDYALLQSRGGFWVGFLSDAIRAFSEIMIDHLETPGPMVAVNSWGMYDSSTDAPAGDPQNYSDNPAHPFNQVTAALAGSGVDVVFAAGNCGSTCPDGRCGRNDVGPGNSIMGANSHPEVVTVAAATVNREMLGYSSEGPGALDHDKPDLAGYSHFSGSGIYPADSGTSAACPVVAGVIAALRSSPAGRNLAPRDMKDLLTRNANAVRGSGWDPQFGAGLIDAGAAFAALP
jgi:subtilisin family serine protease